MKSKTVKIGVLTVIFTLLLLGMILNEVPFLLIGLCIFIYIIAVAAYFLIPILIEHNKADTIEFSEELSIDINLLKKISTENHYFYNGIFYIINKDKKAISIPFAAITEVSKTYIKVNNRRFWKITATYNNEKIEFKFRHNFTLWNKNFPQFLTELKLSNPKAKIDKFNLWSM